ncbi:pentapeptide repeat-containing protein [Kitasatospora sp. NPDC088134]|uniref:pentapeptide repeat-containing protein n=1 Tax=Kitasatospora sp. NPDC088134 TaxID=3364071 RepID=UPI0037FCFA9A
MAFATGLPGLAAVLALIFTFVQVTQTQETLAVTEQGQITDRFNAAITNLGSETMELRLGGIYALQRIMTDSGRDRQAVVDILSAYVRVHSPRPEKAAPVKQTELPVDIATALKVIKTASAGDLLPGAIDFHGADVHGVDLHDFDLSGSDFSGADLTAAHLNFSNLMGAQFVGANLTRASLGGRGPDDSPRYGREPFAGASFRDADLTGAGLGGSNLRYASFPNATMTDTHLEYADLTEATITVEQVVAACPSPETKLPPAMAADPRIRQRLDQLAKTPCPNHAGEAPRS